ncbi:MAG TPA: aminotransferase class V-fold PLP-dependent enzyme [Candidatus Dormibacteraeota bacterium]|nr:aminotransferase class V-fold PLP-dependent enzyme [Candidatus Dormibacteraeota bacterium]
MIHSGRHFLQIPGPTNCPDRILRAMDRPVIDHRGPQFAELALEVLEGIRSIFKTSGPVVMYPGSGSGAWEAAIVNTLSPGDRVLMFETGHFSELWRRMAEEFELIIDYVPGNWRRGADLNLLDARLVADATHEFKAVMVVHNETSTGVTSRVSDIRRLMDSAHHPALLIVDSVSSLAAMDFRHDEWGVDVTIAGSQKGLMLPPGLGFNAISEKALRANVTARMPRSYWDWQAMLKELKSGFFPYTPATNFLYGLRESIQMLNEEGLENVFRRHNRHADATRVAVRAWGLEIVCELPEEYSSSVTAVFTPEGSNSDHLRNVILEKFNMSLGAGLSKLQGKCFRIGHLGSFNDLMLLGALGGVEMGLRLAGLPHREGGVMAALERLCPSARAQEKQPATV